MVKNPLEHAGQLLRQFLVHSFIYYQLHDNLITDSEYDRLCEECFNVCSDASAASLPLYTLVKNQLDDSASGFAIKKYPAEIVQSALHLLYHERFKQHLNFNDFINRMGYRWKLNA